MKRKLIILLMLCLFATAKNNGQEITRPTNLLRISNYNKIVLSALSICYVINYIKSKKTNEEREKLNIKRKQLVARSLILTNLFSEILNN